ncbi:MAG: hypothetical protein IJ223_07235 [Clostridia bacterium]|nr:hypothetical protein [Clostridia bacterium]
MLLKRKVSIDEKGNYSKCNKYNWHDEYDENNNHYNQLVSKMHIVKVLSVIFTIIFMLSMPSKVSAVVRTVLSSANATIITYRCPWGDRTYYKTYADPAYVGYVVGSDGWTGPLLVGTTANSVAYYATGLSTETYSGTLTYNGVTFYYSSYVSWVNTQEATPDIGGLGRTRYNTSAAAYYSSAASREAAQALLQNTGPSISVSNINYGSNLSIQISNVPAGIRYFGVTTSTTPPTGGTGSSNVTTGNTTNYWYRASNSSTSQTVSFSGLGAGTYYVWAKDMVGNRSYKSVTVNKVAASNPTLTSVSKTYDGSALSITVSGGSRWNSIL